MENVINQLFDIFTDHVTSLQDNIVSTTYAACYGCLAFEAYVLDEMSQDKIEGVINCLNKKTTKIFPENRWAFLCLLNATTMIFYIFIDFIWSMIGLTIIYTGYILYNLLICELFLSFLSSIKQHVKLNHSLFTQRYKCPTTRPCCFL